MKKNRTAYVSMTILLTFEEEEFEGVEEGTFEENVQSAAQAIADDICHSVGYSVNDIELTVV